MLLNPLEQTVRCHLIPKLTGREAPNDTERQLFALLTRLGGLNLPDPAATAGEQFIMSKSITKPLVDLIVAKNITYPYDTLVEQMEEKIIVREKRGEHAKQSAIMVRDSLPQPQQLAMDLGSEKGASSWLSALPLEEHKFTLHKTAFRDAIALRYGWPPANTPSHCVCGQTFSIQHALSCPRGGYPSIRHNELRDITASLLKETCHDVATEPTLQPVTSETFEGTSTNKQDGAHLDVVVDGFWGSTFET